MIKRYSELIQMSSFEDRFQYLKLFGSVGYPTFGFERYLNQRFYSSREWKQARQYVIARDDGNDLGVPGFPIHKKVIIHHMNPMNPQDLLKNNGDILDPEFLITISHNTHNAVHFGDESLLPKDYSPRRPGDTKLW